MRVWVWVCRARCGREAEAALPALCSSQLRDGIGNSQNNGLLDEHRRLVVVNGEVLCVCVEGGGEVEWRWHFCQLRAHGCPTHTLSLPAAV